jgi:hypothetical protein
MEGVLSTGASRQFWLKFKAPVQQKLEGSQPAQEEAPPARGGATGGSEVDITTIDTVGAPPYCFKRLNRRFHDPDPVGGRG